MSVGAGLRRTPILHWTSVAVRAVPDAHACGLVKSGVSGVLTVHSKVLLTTFNVPLAPHRFTGFWASYSGAWAAFARTFDVSFGSDILSSICASLGCRGFVRAPARHREMSVLRRDYLRSAVGAPPLSPSHGERERERRCFARLRLSAFNLQPFDFLLARPGALNLLILALNFSSFNSSFFSSRLRRLEFLIGCLSLWRLFRISCSMLTWFASRMGSVRAKAQS